MMIFDKIKRILYYLFNFKKSERRVFLNSYDKEIDFYDLLEYFQKSYTLQSVYNFMDNVFSSVSFYKIVNCEKIYDENIDNMIARALASWYVLGAFLVKFDQNDYDIKPCINLLDGYEIVKRDSYLLNAKNMFDTILEYERLLYELFKNSYNTTFLIPKDNSIIGLPSEVQDAIDTLKNNRIYTQTGGISVLKTNFDKLEINSDFQKYDLENIRRQVIKMISFYYSIPVELLSDGETTFNNKQSAMIYFYNTTVMSFVNDFVHKINKFNEIYNLDKIDYSFDDFYLLENMKIDTKIKQFEFYKNVYEFGDEELKSAAIEKIKSII